MFYRLGTDLFYLCKTEFWFRTVLHTCSRSVFSLLSLTLIWLCIPCLSQVCIHPVKINAVLSLYPSIGTVLFSSCKTECWFGSVFQVCHRTVFTLFPVIVWLSFLQSKAVLEQFWNKSVITDFFRNLFLKSYITFNFNTSTSSVCQAGFEKKFNKFDLGYISEELMSLIVVYSPDGQVSPKWV